MRVDNDKKVRVLHIIDNLNIGGTEKQCVEIVKRTHTNKFSVHLITFGRNGPLYDEVMTSGVPVTEFSIKGGFYRPASIFQLFRISSFMRKHRFHIVQTYGFYSTVPGVLAAKLAGVPVIIAAKRDMNGLLTKSKLWAEKLTWHLCDKIITNSNAIAELLAKQEGLAKEKLVVIHNGVDPQTSPDNPARNTTEIRNFVGMIANFRKEKDHRTLLKAAKIVVKKRSDVKFLLLGSGELEEEMKNYAMELGISDRVQFCGNRSGKDYRSILNSLAISVLASTTEGFPNAILESMACGIPVIANPTGGVVEIIDDGLTGYFFPDKDSVMLAKKIEYLLDNQDVAAKIGLKGQEMVRNKFNYTLMCTHYTDLYESLLKHASVEI